MFLKNDVLLLHRLLQPRNEDDPVGRRHLVRAVQAGGSVSTQASGQAGDRTPHVHDRVVPLRVLADPSLAFRPEGLGYVSFCTIS